MVRLRMIKYCSSTWMGTICIRFFERVSKGDERAHGSSGRGVVCLEVAFTRGR